MARRSPAAPPSVRQAEHEQGHADPGHDPPGGEQGERAGQQGERTARSGHLPELALQPGRPAAGRPRRQAADRRDEQDQATGGQRAGQHGEQRVSRQEAVHQAPRVGSYPCMASSPRQETGARGTARPSEPGANTSLDSTRPSTPVTSRILLTNRRSRPPD